MPPSHCLNKLISISKLNENPSKGTENTEFTIKYKLKNLTSKWKIDLELAWLPCAFCTLSKWAVYFSQVSWQSFKLYKRYKVVMKNEAQIFDVRVHEISSKGCKANTNSESSNSDLGLELVWLSYISSACSLNKLNVWATLYENKWSGHSNLIPQSVLLSLSKRDCPMHFSHIHNK